MSDRVLQIALLCLTSIAILALVAAVVLSITGADRTAVVAIIAVAATIGSGIVGMLAGKHAVGGE